MAVNYNKFPYESYLVDVNIQIWIASKIGMTAMVREKTQHLPLLFFLIYKNDSEQLAYFYSRCENVLDR